MLTGWISRTIVLYDCLEDSLLSTFIGVWKGCTHTDYNSSMCKNFLPD